MEPIIAAAKSMLESSTGLIQTARSLAVNPKDPPKWSVLAGHSRTVSDSIKKLITNMRYSHNTCPSFSDQLNTRLLCLWSRTHTHSRVHVFRENAPGQRECDEAIEVLNNCMREVDKASLAAISQQLTPRDDISHEVRLYNHCASLSLPNLCRYTLIMNRKYFYTAHNNIKKVFNVVLHHCICGMGQISKRNVAYQIAKDYLST